MPKNKKKGANKHRKKNNNSNKISDEFKDCLDCDDYLLAIVLKKCGERYIDVLCSDNIERKLYIRNKIKKSIWLNPSDVLFVSRRPDFSKDNKCDYIYKCKTQDKMFLKKAKKLTIFNKCSDVNVFEEEETIKKNYDELKKREIVIPAQDRKTDLPPSDDEFEFEVDDM